jgi:hypothetical protein
MYKGPQLSKAIAFVQWESVVVDIQNSVDQGVLFPLCAPALGSCDAKQSQWTSGSGLLGMMPGLGT